MVGSERIDQLMFPWPHIAIIQSLPNEKGAAYSDDPIRRPQSGVANPIYCIPYTIDELEKFEIVLAAFALTRYS